MLLAALRSIPLFKRNAFLTKTLLVVRLTTFLLLAFCLHLSARTRAQQINLSEQHVPLDRVFKKITDQTGYLFVYRDEWMKQTHDVSISVRNAGLQQVLDICFKDQPFTYAIIDRMVVLKDTVLRVAPGISVDAPSGDSIRGRVVDSLGAPLVGASVRIKGTTKGTQSDVHGDFRVKHVSAGTVLVVSYTGYIAREFTVGSGVGNYHYVTLQRSQNELDATVIQAYGTTSRRFNVGSISTVDAATIEKQPVTNVMLALQGEVPGLAVTSTSGVPGNTVLLQVRGQNTVMSNAPYGQRPYDQPLIIIDGVPFAPQNKNLSQLGNLGSESSTTGGISVFGGVSPFASINPADIESITILKDADATSIYGTQGSNGVILITTKKGKAGKTTFNLTATTGFNSAARELHVMNTQQYLKYRRDALTQDSVAPSNILYTGGYAPDLTIFDQNKYTNWPGLIYGKTTNNTDIHASVSGGTYNNTFIFSGGYTRSDFNYPGNFSDQRLTLHSLFHHTSNDNRLTLDFGTDVGYDQNHSAGYAGNKDVLLAPNLPDLKNPDGSLLWVYKGVDLSSYQFYANLLQPANLDNYNINNSLHLSYKIISGLTFGLTAGYNRNTSDETTKLPAVSQTPLYGAYRSAEFAKNNYQTLNIEPQIDYNVTIGKGTLSALAGGTYKKNTNYQQTLQGTGYSNDQLLGSIDGAATVYPYDASSLYKYVAAFARLKYIYNQEFIVSMGGRRDGSSNFGPGRQFGNFGSMGAGWIFTQERPVTKALPFLSYGKLSGSYGTSGSDGIAPYKYQAFWQPVTYVPAVQGVQPSQPLNLYNPDYGWATKKSLNIALDLGLFHDRLLLNTTFYRDREGGQLGGYPLPAQTGFGTVLQNLPAEVQNQGWEFSFTSNNIQGPKFSWKTNFNISFNRNKLLSFPNLAGSSYADIYKIGAPTSIIFGYRYKGIDPTTGLFQYLNAKDQLTSAPAFGLIANGGDQVPIANREVKYMGGFGNTFTYKRVSLYIFFQFSSQTAPNWMYTLYGNGLTPGSPLINMPVAVLGNYWTGPGDTHATLQHLVTSYSSRAYRSASAFSQSSGAYSDDTYVRLKTLSLSYSLPDNLVKSAHIHDLRIYCNAQNLLTFTDYKVADPETFNDFTQFPVQRIVAFGLNCNF
ncbi:MAG: SusC/RagA family TonB-linked outer membrane protein [Bacteroidetes bacterium]|nr:SusC/RagA family TonB-linked outer membrane protein [Bacteroidota bacterium]